MWPARRAQPPSGRRHLVEQAGIGGAGEHADERGGPQAERRAPARPVERQRVERLAPREDRDRRARGQRPGLEIGQQARVLLGLLGDAQDGGLGARLHLGQRGAGGSAERGLEVDRVAVRARLGVAQQLVELGFDARRERALEPHRLDVALRPREADDRGQEPLEQRVAAEDRVRRRTTRRGQLEAPARRGLDEAVRREPAAHLAGGLGRHADVAAELGGGGDPAVGTHHAQREQVLLRGGRDVGGVVTALHAPECRAAGGGRWRATDAAPDQGGGPAPRGSRRGRQIAIAARDHRDEVRHRDGDPEQDRPDLAARTRAHRQHRRDGHRDGERHDRRERADRRGRGQGEQGGDDERLDGQRQQRQRLGARRGELGAAGHGREQGADAVAHRRPGDQRDGQPPPPAGPAREGEQVRGRRAAGDRLEVGQRLDVGADVARSWLATASRSVAAGRRRPPPRRPSRASPSRRRRRPWSSTRSRSSPSSGSAGSAPGASAPAPFEDGSAAVSRVAAPAAADGPADAAVGDVPSASARVGASGPRLVLGAVLARIGILARVDRPVRPRRRAVPGAALPLRVERRVGGLVVGRRARGRLAEAAARVALARRRLSPRAAAAPSPLAPGARAPRRSRRLPTSRPVSGRRPPPTLRHDAPATPRATPSPASNPRATAPWAAPTTNPCRPAGVAAVPRSRRAARRPPGSPGSAAARDRRPRPGGTAWRVAGRPSGSR